MLVAYPVIYKVFAPSQVVVWDFWTINSMWILFVLWHTCRHFKNSLARVTTSEPTTTSRTCGQWFEKEDLGPWLWLKGGMGPALPVVKIRLIFYKPTSLQKMYGWYLSIFQCLIFCVLTTPCCRVASGCFAPAFLAILRNSNCLLNVQTSRIGEKISWWKYSQVDGHPTPTLKLRMSLLLKNGGFSQRLLPSFWDTAGLFSGVFALSLRAFCKRDYQATFSWKEVVQR